MVHGTQRAHGDGYVGGAAIERDGRIVDGNVRESLAIARMCHDLTEDEVRPLSRAATARVFSSGDAKEGPRAFLEKGAPVWKGA